MSYQSYQIIMEVSMNTLKPAINFGPGATLRDEIDERGWSQEDFAEIMGVSKNTVNNLVNNKVAITVDMAILLGKALNQDPEVWLRLDSSYRLQKQQSSERVDATERRALAYAAAPVKEMQKYGWISQFEDPYEAVKRFWGVKKIDPDFAAKMEDQISSVALRSTKTLTTVRALHLRAWLHMASKIAKTRPNKRYNKSELEKLIGTLYSHTRKTNGVAIYLESLTDIGVKFIVLRHLSKTYLTGACFWEGKNPVVAYTGRYDRVDGFWFTLAHELGHVLREHSNHAILDEDDVESTEKIEHEADQIAEEALKHQEILAKMDMYGKYVSEARVRSCAKEVGVNEAIVVGVLQHKKQIPYRNLSYLRGEALSLIPEKYKVPALPDA